MADTAEDTLLEEFSEIAGQTSAGSSAGLIEQMSESMGSLSYTPQTLTTSGQVAGNTSSSGSGGGTSGLSIATSVLESGLGIVPLIGGLIGLFDGGGSSTPQPLTKYAMPNPISFQGAETSEGIEQASTASTGLPRAAGGGGSSGGTAAPSAGGSNGSTTSNGSSQITVQVQAMDAQSFMDRSSDIAAAVRDAMLNLHSINDVVSNL
jgi:hypothetical protein